MGGRIWYTLVLLMGIFAARAAEISPAFETELSLAKSGEFVSGIILLENPIDIQNLDAMLHARKATRTERYAEVYSALHYNARTTQPKFRGELDAGKELGLVEGYTAYWIDNLFVVSAKPEFFNALKHRSDIRGLSENFEAVLIEPVDRHDLSVSDDEMRRPDRNPLDTETTTPGLDAIGTTRVNRELGITGQGVLVANLDTGVDGTHPALAARWRGLTAGPAAAWHDVIDAGPNFPVDNNDHGTHVMGTICGREIEANGDTTTVGCAPDAEWIACNAIDQGVSNAFDNDVIDGYQWFANPDGDSTTINDVPDIVQNSWGVNQSFPGYSQCWDLWNTVILNLEALGCVVTFSAGNEGPSANTMRAPGIHEMNPVQIFSVGAVSVPQGSAPPYAIASFSSRGPSPCNGTHIKPEIVAPGVNILSSVPGNNYSLLSGTSMAGPHIAGVVALMRQACPDCDPTTIKTALLSTAIDDGYLPEGEDNVFGYGFVDAWAAVNFVYGLGSIGGIVISGGSPVQDVEVSVLENGHTALTAEDGTFATSMSAGTYTVTFSKFEYITQTFENIFVLEGEQTELDPSLALAPTATVSGHVFASSGQAEANALIEVLDAPVASTQADVSGFYSLEMPTGNTYTVRATGERGAAREVFLLESELTINYVMPQELYCYDFESSTQGWLRDTVNASATRGRWGRMVPQQTVNNESICQPGEDHTAAGMMCFVTDGLAGGTAGENDVDGGSTTLLSPIWNLSGKSNVVIDMYSWYSNDNGNNPGEDFFDVLMTNDDGANWVSLLHENVDWEEWRRSFFVVEDYLPLTSQMRMKIIAQDLGNGSLVEAAVDDICVLASAILPPQDLAIVMLDNGMQLSWEPVTGATSYTVWRGLEFPPTTANTTILMTVTDTFFIDQTDLDTLGYYIVTANR